MTNERDPDDNVLPENVTPIRDEFMFRFQPAVHDPDELYFIEVERWTRGHTSVIHTEDGFNRERGIQTLRDIGHSWRYDSTHMAYLKKTDGTLVATLHIFENTYRVDMAGEEES